MKRSVEKKVALIGENLKAESEFRSPYWSLSYDFPWNPDPLCSGNNYNIYDEMKDDDQIKSAISVKKDMVVNTGWQIVCENEEIRDEITRSLENINQDLGLDSSFDDVLRDMLSSYEYGFSLTEPIYAIKNNIYVYRALRTRAPHAFKFELDKTGLVTQIVQAGERGDLFFKPKQFIHHVYQMEFGNPYGKADLKAAYNAWKAKKFIIKFWAIYIEKFASGTVVGKFPKNWDTNKISRFHTILKSIQNATSIAIPEDAILEFVQMDRDSSNAYKSALDYYNMQIARSILVPDLMGLGGSETKGGSYALGKEQFKVFLGIIKKDRESLARKITNKLVQPLVRVNYGDNIDCYFEFMPFSSADEIELMKLWLEAVKAKAFKPNVDEINYLRNITGFPEGEVTEAPKPEMPPFLRQSPHPPPKEAMPEEPEEIETQSYAYRTLTKYEAKIDFNAIENTFNREEKRAVSFLSHITKDIYMGLIDKIQSKGLLRKFKPDKINEIQPSNLRPMNVALRNYFVDLYKQATNQAQKEIFPNEPKKYDIDALLPDEFLDLLRNEAFKMVGDYSTDLTKKAKTILIQAIKDGVGEVAALQLLRSELKVTSDTWTKLVVRTKTTEIYNEARKRYWETDPLAKQLVEAYQWSAVLDDRTSDICRHLDGKIYGIGDLSGWLKPPAHFNCRSILVPITKFEEYKPDKDSVFNKKKLVDMGGGLLKYEIIEKKPFLTNSKTISQFGDSIIVSAAGEGKHIEIVSIDINNLDIEKAVVIGFKIGNNDDFKYEVMLDKQNRNWQKEFVSEYWKLPSNTDFKINLSAPIVVSYSVQYMITNKAGDRVA